MNADQKQRAEKALCAWRSTAHALHADLMAALLQELIDAPEPAPFGYFKAEPFGWTDCSETDEGAIALYTAQPANNQSEQHLEMVNAPAPSVPDADLEPSKGQLTQLLNGVGKCFVEDSVREFLRVWIRDWTVHKLAARQTYDLVRDAERYRWLRTYNTAKHPAVAEAFFLGDENLDAEIDAAIAAKKGGA